jgi:hypothetical protein
MKITARPVPQEQSPSSANYGTGFAKKYRTLLDSFVKVEASSRHPKRRF